MAVIWPFPGQAEPEGPPKPLPPTRFAVGELVTTRWGRATVIAICDWAYDDGRAILVKHDWSSAPPGFGHIFSDADIEPRVEQPSEEDEAEEDDAHAEAGDQCADSGAGSLVGGDLGEE